IETLAGANPVEQGRDVLVGIFALKAVVEFQERFYVTFRSADVRKDDGAAELVDEIIVPPQIGGAVLRFRAAVDIDDNRPRSGKLRGVRQIEKSGDFFSVERFPADQLRFRSAE